MESFVKSFLASNMTTCTDAILLRLLNITFYRSETTQVENDFAAGRRRHDDLRYLDDVMESSSRRAAFEPRLHQGDS